MTGAPEYDEHGYTDADWAYSQAAQELQHAENVAELGFDAAFLKRAGIAPFDTKGK